MQLSEIYVTIAVFTFAAFIFYLFAARDRARIRFRAEVQKELIAKFSPQELAEFLNSDAGKMLIRGSSYEVAKPVPAPPKSAKQIVGEVMSWGVLILAVGLAIYAMNGLTMVSSVLIALGIAFEVNSLLGYVYSRKLGHWDVPPPNSVDRTNGS
jgi:hypothetical protein